VQRWNRKLGALRKHLRGWARHHHGVYKTQKENLQSIVTNLDTQAENRTLTDEERNQLESARDDLIKLLGEEEIKYYQSAKMTDVLLGIIILDTFRWLQMANIVRNVSFP